MIKIPYVINPEPDELLASWIIRLAAANGIDDLKNFLNAYVVPHRALTNKSVRFRRDFLIPYELFWCALNGNANDMRDVFFATSTFTCVAPFFTVEQRQRYINYALIPNNTYEALYPAPHGTISKLMICPECVAHELNDRGFFILHRTHHLPAVRVCYKHGCSLVELPNDYFTLDLHSMPLSNSKKTVENTIAEQQFAQFAVDFMNAQFCASIDDIRKIIVDKVAEKPNERIVIPKDLSLLFNGDVNHFFKIGLRGQYVDAGKALLLLYALFGTVQSISQRLHEKHDIDPSLAQTINRSGYTLVGNYRNDIITLKHNACGHLFMTSPYGFSIGWRCERCDSRSLQEKYQQLIETIGNNEYQPISPFESMDKALDICHKKCGKLVHIKPRKFMYEKVRCDCDRRVDFQTAQHIIAQYEGFELLDFSRTDKPVTIKHICGNTFTIYYMKFLQSPRCRVCQKAGHLAIRTTEDYKRDIAELVGNEYTLVGSYNGPHKRLMIRHQECGKTHQYYPYYFLDGGRCPFCSVEMTFDELSDYVDRYSYGLYSVTRKSTKNLYEVRNNDTNEIIKLSRLKILQELRRPTISPFLPLIQKNETAVLRPHRSRDIILTYIIDNYDQEPIFIEDIPCKDMTIDERAYVLNNLKKAGVLRHITTGVYGFANKEYSNDQIITARYIRRSNHRIGFFRGEDYAYEIGLRADKPKEWHIASNKESDRTQNRKITFCGEAIHIKGVSTKVNDENYLILEALDFLIQYRQYTDAPLSTIIEAVRKHIRLHNGQLLPYEAFAPYIEAYKTANIRTMLKRMVGALCGGTENAKNH